MRKVNELGLKEIREQLINICDEEHKVMYENADFNDPVFAAWASDIEDSVLSGNGAGAEVPGRITRSGRPETITVSSEGFTDATKAAQYAALYNSNKKDAEQLAEEKAAWKNNDWDHEITIFGFDDGSAIYASGQEFRAATAAEIAQYNI